jgi:hypothetical protein
MKTYKLTDDYENFYTFTIKGVELYSKMPGYSPKFNSVPRRDEWVTPNASFYATANYLNKKVAIPDLTTWVMGNLVLNSKAYEILSEVLKTLGEFLPVSVEGIDYYIFNTLKVIDDRYINKDKAREVVDGGINAGVENISFDTDGLDGAYLFKSKTDRVLHTYCNDNFKQLILDKDIKGLLFNEMIIEE